ncbi:hypothetical protein KEF29_03490 [Streptomyces tuirus]|uniref:Uncharacterized protein n=1 Tax=Streptomyces tuirus TaxID=68278 RepID=A0A941J1D9_9ACTN|nr:hypothetical protein [Streptomyces tuirus]
MGVESVLVDGVVDGGLERLVTLAPDGAEVGLAVGLGRVLVLVAALAEPVGGVLDVAPVLACLLAGVGDSGGGDLLRVGSTEDGGGPLLERFVVVLALGVERPEVAELLLLFGGDRAGRRRRGSGGSPLRRGFFLLRS